MSCETANPQGQQSLSTIPQVQGHPSDLQTDGLLADNCANNCQRWDSFRPLRSRPHGAKCWRWGIVALGCIALAGCPQTAPVSPAPPEVPMSTPPNADILEEDRVNSPSASGSRAEAAVPEVPAGQVLPITATVELGGETIGLEVARTAQEQGLGLMYRQDLPDNRGMIFPFDPPRPVSFWMRNVAIFLDMVFIYQGRIVAIEADVPPCTTASCPTYGPGQQPVNAVIELRGGRAAELGVQVGDRVQVEPLEPADRDSNGAPDSSPGEEAPNSP